jgi:hypothetical protein
MKNLLIRVFWIVVLVNLDPGGFKHVYLSSTQMTIASLLEFTICVIIFAYFNKESRFSFLQNKFVTNYLLIIFFWFLYYLAIHYGVKNRIEYPGVFVSILRNIKFIYSALLVIPIAYFIRFSAPIFIRYLFISSAFICLFFIVSIYTPVKVITTWSGFREAGGGITRIFMYGYGLIFFIIPLTIAGIFLKAKVNKFVYVSFFLSAGVILLTVYRREMIAVALHIFIISILSAKIRGKFIFQSIANYLNPRSIFLGISSILLLVTFAPGIIQSSIKLTNDTLIDLGIIESRYRRVDDVRLSLSAKKGIVKAIEENPSLGTGFHTDWYSGDGGRNQWEGADYIFLASVAMYGIIGVIIFLPFYIYTFRLIFKFIKLSNKFFFSLLDQPSIWLLIIIGVASCSEFIKNIIEYPNWFYPIGAVPDRAKYYIYLGLLLGSYFGIQEEQRKLTT